VNRDPVKLVNFLPVAAELKALATLGSSGVTRPVLSLGLEHQKLKKLLKQNPSTAFLV
jgi:hypothetical protein